MSTPIIVLVVDDSALMRRYLRDILEESGRFQVFMARDGQDALSQIKAVNPDVVTLDINMPVMDGLTCLSHIMTESPRPVVMVSSLTEKGALATFEALELGAVDYIAKPGGTVSHNIKEVSDQIVGKILAAAGARPRRSGAAAIPQRELIPKKKETAPVRLQKAPPRASRVAQGLVLIGVSTGGPGTLEEILPKLPRTFPLPVLVAQHMPANFTQVFAQRIGRLCQLQVIEVDRPTPLEPGKILIAKGDADILVERVLGRRVAKCAPADPDFLWHPSVERMVRSAMIYFKPNELIGVELTGMGNDGAPAMAELHKQGGHTIAEAEETAVVFGMPRELIVLGGAEMVLPMGGIADQLIRWT